MITNKEELIKIILKDAKANARISVKARLFGDEIWKFQLSLRKLEYFIYKSSQSRLYIPHKLFYKMKYHNLSIKLGFSIPVNAIGEGLSLPHYGTIVVSNKAKIGKNCRIHEGVTIGSTNGSDLAPVIGDNVFIGSGAKILGNITIADDVCIGANTVVTKSIIEHGTTWAGSPAKKISDNNSHSNLSDMLFV